jgi:7,8-dihydropterin-6-yl-methyl-4-(beta-D-ribofuranosyl)aminobenzene 5'-phosphate synthase
MKITTLVENAVMTSQGHIGEHGLSFLIEHDGGKLLFDTGQGMALLNNAEKLGFNAQDFKKVVLSHGHYDHAGGLKRLVESGVTFELTTHPDAFDEKLALFPGKGFIPIGIPGGKDFFVTNNVPLHLEAGPVEIAPGIMTTGEIPMLTDFEKIEPMLFVRKDGKEIPDPLADDQALILDTEKGFIVLLGCAHRGVVNTLYDVAEMTGAKTIHAIIGGLHLERAPESQIQKTIEALRAFEPKIIGVTHCTGIRAIVPLINAFGSKVVQSSVGMSMSF